jgi:AcrR family transcriptional regulator
MTETAAVRPPLAAGEEAFDPNAERILAAARAQFVEFGMRRTSLDDIALAAGISRATLFRRFPNRDALVSALVAREAQAAISAVDARIAAIEDPEDSLAAGAVAAIRAIVGNDLLQRLLVTDPDQMLPVLTVRSGPIMALGRQYVAGQLQRLRAEGAPLIGDLDVIAELLARFVLSFAGNQESILPLHDDARLEQIIRSTVVPMVLRRR